MGVYPPWQPVNVSFMLLLLFLYNLTNKFFFFFFFYYGQADRQTDGHQLRLMRHPHFGGGNIMAKPTYRLRTNRGPQDDWSNCGLGPQFDQSRFGYARSLLIIRSSSA